MVLAGGGQLNEYHLAYFRVNYFLQSAEYLKNPMDGGVWPVTVHGVSESDDTELLGTHKR